jgi:hypothetical protein
MTVYPQLLAQYKTGIEILVDFWCIIYGDPINTTPLSIWPTMDCATKVGEGLGDEMVSSGKLRIIRVADWVSVYRLPPCDTDTPYWLRSGRHG